MWAASSVAVVLCTPCHRGPSWQLKSTNEDARPTDFLFSDVQDELYMDGVACLADILTQRKFYTKAEMLARKALEEKVKVSGNGAVQSEIISFSSAASVCVCVCVVLHPR